jgi:hypothetical protein
MAYISTKEIVERRKLIKEKYPLKKGWKFSIVGRNYSCISVSILEAPFNLLSEKFEERGNETINPYFFESIENQEKKNVLIEIYNIINKGNHDKSDAMTDYFDVGFYTNLEIGKWDKRFVISKKS